MTNLMGNGAGARKQKYTELPTGVEVASFRQYHEVLAAMEKLSTEEFPVQKVSIVGSDMRSVERVVGAMSYAKAALSGALSGAWIGFFFGLLLMLWGGAESAGFFAFAILVCVGFGMISGVISYALSKKRKNFRSVSQLIPAVYTLVVEPDGAGEARRILGPSVTLPPVAPPPTDHPYGGQPPAGPPAQ